MTRRLSNARGPGGRWHGWPATARHAARALGRGVHRVVTGWLFGTLVPVTIAAVAAVLLAASIGPLATMSRPASTLGILATTVDTAERRLPLRSGDADGFAERGRSARLAAGRPASRDEAWWPDQSATGTRPDHAH